MAVKVLNVFHTSIGVIVILNFPEGIMPKVGKALKKGGDVYYIENISFNQPGEFKDLNPTCFACKLVFQNGKIELGDIFEYD